MKKKLVGVCLFLRGEGFFFKIYCFGEGRFGNLGRWVGRGSDFLEFSRKRLLVGLLCLL